MKAVENVNKIIGPKLIERGLKVTDQRGIDEFLIELDGTQNKCTRLNSLLIVL